MKTRIERRLEKIQEIAYEKRLVLSCDIYYDSLGVHRGEQFVVKLHGGVKQHFRSDHILKSLNQAIEYLESL